MPRKKRGRSTEGADDDPPADKVSVRNRPTGRLRVTRPMRRVFGPNGFSCYVFDDEGAQLAELARVESKVVPTGTHGTSLRRQGEIFCLVDYVEQSADPATSVVHFIQHGNGHALDVAGTLLADALKDRFDTTNLFLAELVPRNREVAADGDPDFDLVTNVARKIGVEHLEGLLRQTGRPKGIGSPAYNASKTKRREFHADLSADPQLEILDGLPAGATVVIVARRTYSNGKLLAALAVLRDDAQERKLNLNFEGVAFGQCHDASSGVRPTEELAPGVYKALMNAANKELQECADPATASNNAWGIAYRCKEHEVLKGGYVGTMSTRTTSDVADSRELVAACKAGDGQRAWVAALDCLELRIREHERELKKAKKACRAFNEFYKKYRPAWNSNNEAAHRFRSTQVLRR